MLLKAAVIGTNIYDLHYSYAKLIELYYGNLENETYYEKCKEFCLKDIDIFEEIRKSSYNEYMTIAKRTYKAALITREEFSELLYKIKNKLLLPVIPAFKILIELYFLKRNYVDALLIIEKALFYDMIEEEKNYFKDMLNEAKNHIYQLQLEKDSELKKIENEKLKIEQEADDVTEEVKLEKEITENSNNKKEYIENKQIQEQSKIDIVIEKKTRMYLEFIKTEEEIENGDFLKIIQLIKLKKN